MVPHTPCSLFEEEFPELGICFKFIRMYIFFSDINMKQCEKKVFRTMRQDKMGDAGTIPVDLRFVVCDEARFIKTG